MVAAAQTRFCTPDNDKNNDNKESLHDLSLHLLGLEEHDLLLHAGVEAEHGGHSGGPGAHIVTRV